MIKKIARVIWIISFAYLLNLDNVIFELQMQAKPRKPYRLFTHYILYYCIISIFGLHILKLLGYLVYKHKTKPEKLHYFLECSGPIFIKFGQMISTRHDLMQDEYIEWLSKLRTNVKPFDNQEAINIIKHSLNLATTINDNSSYREESSFKSVFSEFSEQVVASASIAQVYRAKLAKYQNRDVAVKVLRPNIQSIINNDIAILYTIASIIEYLFETSKNFKLKALIKEFHKHINNELNFNKEYASANKLRELHLYDHRIIIPKMYPEYCNEHIITMQWLDGIPIDNKSELLANNIDITQLSHYGIEIFYTQVFHFGIFHADMHPGNILCSKDGRLIALDFGIIGRLSEDDKRYLAINMLAFFNRDYRKVATTHVESGWVSYDASIEDLENAISAVCDPIFNKPLADISFGQVLIKLFQVFREFGIVVQPQLTMLQKTIINIEGIGRILNPDLDIWASAKPILSKWINEQTGIRGFIQGMKQEMHYLSYNLPTMPRKINHALRNLQQIKALNDNYISLIKNYQRQNYILYIIIIIILIVLY